MGRGDTLEAAALALAAEVRRLADVYAARRDYRDAPNWRRRGPFAVALAALPDEAVVARSDYRRGGEPGRHLDDDGPPRAQRAAPRA